MADHTTETWIDQSRAGLVSCEHIVRAALVSRFTVSHRTNDRELVRDGSQAWQRLADDFARLGLDRSHLTAIFKRTKWFGIERFLMSHSTRQENMNHALRFCWKKLVILLISASFSKSQEITKCQTKST